MGLVVEGVSEGGGGETRPTLLLFYLRLFGQKERERERNKENEKARDQTGGKRNIFIRNCKRRKRKKVSH